MTRALSCSDAEVEFLGAFENGETFLESPVRKSADVVLLDLGLPGVSGTEVIRTLAREASAAKVLALTVFDDSETVFAALNAGAKGFLLKGEPIDRVIQAMRDILNGRLPLSSGVTHFFVDQALRFASRIVLSPRETRVAVSLSEGASYAECSEELGITLGTVQDYVKRIYRKLGVTSKRELRLWVEETLRSS